MARLINPPVKRAETAERWTHEDLLEVAPVEGIIHSTALPNFHLNINWLWPDQDGRLPNPYEVLKDLGAI